MVVVGVMRFGEGVEGSVDRVSWRVRGEVIE